MAASPEKEREQNSMEDKRQLSPDKEEKRQPSPEEEKRQVSSEREENKRQVPSESKEKRQQSPEKEKKGQLSPENEERRQLSPEKEEKGQLSPEEEKKRQLSLENEERRRVYQERFFNLESRLQGLARKVMLCKKELYERARVLKIIIKEKSVDTISWKETSLCNELKIDLSSFAHDLRKCLECNMKDYRVLEDIHVQDNHQSEEAELMIEELRDLHTKTLNLHLKLNTAEEKEKQLSSAYRGLEKKYNQLLLALSEMEKRKQLTYPTKSESDEDAGGHPRKAKDSRARSPPDSPESRMLKKGK